MATKIRVRKCGARGFPWMVLCDSCSIRVVDGPDYVNSPIGFRTWPAALRSAIKHRVSAHPDFDWRDYGPCETCGAAAGSPCTVGQYGSPSPHTSSRAAALPHARRGYLTLGANP